MTEHPPKDTRDLIADLCADLEPVRRIPPLRVVAGGTLLLAAATAALALAVLGLRVDVRALDLPLPRLAMLGGLASIGLGALCACLGASVPGREAVRRLGLGLVVLGALAAGGAGALLLGSAGGCGALDALWLWAGVRCFVTAAVLALPPGYALLRFVRGAAPHRPRLALATAAAGVIGFGAFAVQLSCPSNEVLHGLLWHAGAPLLGGLLVALSLAALGVRVERE